MGRRILVAVAMFAVVVGSASQASAQVALPGGWNAKLSWGGSVTESSHQDEGIFGMTMAFHPFMSGYLSAGGEVRIGYEWDYGGVQKYLGTIRYQSDTAFKWPCFVDLNAGLEHFTGDSVFFLEPAAGLVFPWGFRDWKLFGQIGVPMHFYDGNTEIGFSGQVGFYFPLLKK